MWKMYHRVKSSVSDLVRSIMRVLNCTCSVRGLGILKYGESRFAVGTYSECVLIINSDEKQLLIQFQLNYTISVCLYSKVMQNYDQNALHRKINRYLAVKILRLAGEEFDVWHYVQRSDLGEH